MHLYKTIKSFLFDKDYFINIFENHIHLFGFLDILSLEEKNCSFRFEKFTLELYGEDFRVLKLTKNELLIQGKIAEMRIL